MFPSEACDWLVNHYTSSSGAIKRNQNQTYLPDLLWVQQLLPGPHLLFGPFLPRAPEGLENQEALVDPAIPENQEVPSVKKENEILTFPNVINLLRYSLKTPEQSWNSTPVTNHGALALFEFGDAY